MQQCGTKQTTKTECTYYYCNQQGSYRPTGTRKHVMKSQGACKMDEQCTAYMKATKCVSDGVVSVEYRTNHSHNIAIQHLRIPDNVRVSVAAKIQHGVAD